MVHSKNLKSKKDKVQTILVSKKEYPKIKNALRHLEDIGYDLTRFDKFIDETPNFYKFTQSKESLKKESYDMTDLEKALHQYQKKKELHHNDHPDKQQLTKNLSGVYKTDSRGNTWQPNYVDMGSYTVDTNQPNYHVPNKAMTMPRSSIIPVSQPSQAKPIGGNPNTWTPKNLPQK